MQEPELHLHPSNPTSGVYGHLLDPGDVVDPDDVYDGSDGSWAPFPIPGLPIAPDNEARVIRPVIPFASSRSCNWCGCPKAEHAADGTCYHGAYMDDTGWMCLPCVCGLPD